MKHPIRLVYVAFAFPADISFEQSGLMDALSDLRDNTPGEKLIEWAQAPCPQTGKRSGVVVDGETEEMLELFESVYVSPNLLYGDKTGNLQTFAPRTSQPVADIYSALSKMPQKPSDWSADNPDAVRAYDEALSLWRFQCCELAGPRAEG